MTAPSRAGRTPVVLFSSAFGPGVSENPYLDLLARGLEPAYRARSFSWRAALVEPYDVLHVHWPEFLVSGTSPAKRAAKALLFVLLAARLTLARTPVVRTVHNLAPHGGTSGRVERRLTRWLEDRTDVHVVMNGAARPATRGPVRLVPHGHYRDTFVTPPSRLRASGVVACFGTVRRYKGVEALLGAYRDLSGRLPAHRRPRLRIAGSPADATVAREIGELAAGLDGAEATLRRLDDAELEAVVDSAQVVVLPYRTVHNSGAALFALSRGRPVLLPDGPAVRELAEELGDRWVRTYAGELDAEDLAGALAWSAGTAAADAVPDLSRREWSTLGAATADAYDEATRRRRARRGDRPRAALGRRAGARPTAGRGVRGA